MADTLADPSAAVDEFAQTRGADDLFDDEIIPIAGEQQIQHVDEPPVEDPKPIEPAAQEPAPSRQTRAQAREGASGERGGRGRGRGRGRGGRGGQDAGSKHATVAKEEKAESGVKDSSSSEQPEVQATEDTDDNGSESKGAAAKAEANRVQAVRGDRSGTGGIKKPKLTEEELAERMAAAKLNAAKLSAAHARAEADEASFNEREKAAAAKRRQEVLNRKVMDNERERNRMRKLGAQTGREWDAEKKEEDYSGRRGGGSQFRRGMHGGVAGTPRRESNNDYPERTEESPGPRGRGRGRGGRGRGRGGRGHPNRDENPTTTEAPSAPGVDNQSEFPSLPGGSSQDTPAKLTTDTVKPPVLDPLSALDSPAEGTWADQVDSAQNA